MAGGAPGVIVGSEGSEPADYRWETGCPGLCGAGRLGPLIRLQPFYQPFPANGVKVWQREAKKVRRNLANCGARWRIRTSDPRRVKTITQPDLRRFFPLPTDTANRFRPIWAAASWRWMAIAACR